jgi:hypothetical protein
MDPDCGPRNIEFKLDKLIPNNSLIYREGIF